MRTFLTLVAAVAILCGAYGVTFGLPAPLAAMIAPQGERAAVPKVTARAGAGNGPRAAGGGGVRDTTVVTQALTLLPYDSILNTIGTGSALRSVEVVSNAAGTVIEANLLANRDVRAGEVLVRLDARTQTLNLEITQAERDQASETVARYERLRANGTSTITDVTLSEAQLRLRLAEAALGLAQVALEDRTIRAPIAGRLSLSDVDIGDVLTASSHIASIDNSADLVVEFELPERAIGLLPRATSVLISTSTFAGRVFDGKIISFDSRIDTVTRSVTVKAQIANPDGILWPGMTFAVRLIQQSDPMPALPSTAITWSRAGSSVWIDVDGLAKSVPATILFRRDDLVWVEADIPVGTMVVTEGAQKLREGARITTPGAGRTKGGGRGGPKADADAARPTSPKEPT